MLLNKIYTTLKLSFIGVGVLIAGIGAYSVAKPHSSSEEIENLRTLAVEEQVMAQIRPQIDAGKDGDQVFKANVDLQAAWKTALEIDKSRTVTSELAGISEMVIGAGFAVMVA